VNIVRSQDDEGAHFEEEAVLEAAVVLEVLVLPERIVQVAHAHGKVPPRELVDHLGRHRRGVGALDLGGVLRGDAGEEAHGEVFEDGEQPIVLVEPGQGAAGVLEGAAEPGGELGRDEGELVAGGDVGVAVVDEDPTAFDEVGDARPVDLRGRLGVLRASGIASAPCKRSRRQRAVEG
jgi:hypothetical protein